MKVLFKLLTAGLVIHLTLQTSPAASFSVVGPLNQAREGHTATLLTNGFVLATGGVPKFSFPPSAPTNTTELYDPIARTWKFAPPMSDARVGHAAALLPNGNILVTGGSGTNSDSPYLTSAEVYDPVANSWVSAGQMSTPRDLHTATVLTNGMVLVAGGFNGVSMLSAELFNPTMNSWTNAGIFSGRRYGHTATLLTSGSVLIAGGQDGNRLASACLYVPATGVWTNTGSMNTARYFHTSTLLPDGRVLAAGGFGSDVLASAELYDPATGTWTNTGSLHFARQAHSATLLPNGMVLVAGGAGSGAYPLGGELYDPNSGTWILTSPISVARGFNTATVLTNGQVLVAGGMNSLSDGVYSTSEVYDLTSATITLAGFQLLPGGSFQFAFTNDPGQSFSVLASSDPAAPLANWPVIGTTTEISSGQYQFTDLQATNYPQQFYHVRSP